MRENRLPTNQDIARIINWRAGDSIFSCGLFLLRINTSYRRSKNISPQGKLFLFGTGLMEYPQADSNRRLWLRRPTLYPLSYGGESR